MTDTPDVSRLLDVLLDDLAGRIATRLNTAAPAAPAPAPAPHAVLDEFHVWLNAKEAMTYLGIGEGTLRRLYLKGKLKVARPARPGTRVRFHRSWLDAYVQGLPMPEDEPAAAPTSRSRRSR